MNKENKKSILPAVVLLLVIALFTVISVAKPQSDFSEAENRVLWERPDWEVEAFLEGDYQEAYENYLSDQMIGREFFVKVKTQLDLLMGKKDINGVYLAKDDYLIEKYAMSDFDEERISDNLFYLSEYLNTMQKRYGKERVQCLFIPSKETALASFLPDYAVPFDTSFVPNKLSDTVDCDILDLTASLSEHSEEYIYYRTDHHWTMLGAYYGYAAYKELRGERATPLTEYQKTLVATDFYGTTYDKIQRKIKADTIYQYALLEADKQVSVDFDDGTMVWDSCYDESYLSTKDKYSYFFGGNTAKIRITTGANNEKCLLLLKDSFSNSFVEFLLPDYAYIYMIDLRYTNEDIYTLMEDISTEHTITDVLVMYNTEKFMLDSNLSALGEP